MEKNQVWSAIVYSGWLSSRGLRGYFICFNMNERPAGKFSPFSFGWLLDLTFISLVGKRQRALSHIDLNITFCKGRTKGSCLKAQKRMIFVFFSNDEEANVKEEVFCSTDWTIMCWFSFQLLLPISENLYCSCSSCWLTFNLSFKKTVVC